MRIDVYDALAMIGLILLGTGLWLVWPPVSLIVVGAIMLIVGTVGAARQGNS